MVSSLSRLWPFSRRSFEIYSHVSFTMPLRLGEGYIRLCRGVGSEDALYSRFLKAYENYFKEFYSVSRIFCYSGAELVRILWNV